MQNNIKDIVKSYYHGVKTRNLSAVPLDSALDFEGALVKTSGREAFEQVSAQMFEILKDVNVKLIAVDGDNAFATWDFVTSTPVGAIPICDHIHVQNGRIKTIRAYFDPRKLVELEAQSQAAS